MINESKYGKPEKFGHLHLFYRFPNPLTILLGTLGASLLGYLLAEKEIVRAGSGNQKGKGIARAGTGNDWDF